MVEVRADRDLRRRSTYPVFTIMATCRFRARGLSVHTQRGDTEHARKLPSLRGRLICRLSLGAGSGRILPTGRPSHHTWWPLAGYDVLSRCSVETT